MAVVVFSLLAGGGGYYWMQTRNAGRAVHAAASEGARVAPQAVVTAAAPTPPRYACPGGGGALVGSFGRGGVAGGRSGCFGFGGGRGFPSAAHRHAAAPSGAAHEDEVVASDSIVPAGTAGAAAAVPPFADDLAPRAGAGAGSGSGGAGGAGGAAGAGSGSGGAGAAGAAVRVRFSNGGRHQHCGCERDVGVAGGAVCRCFHGAPGSRATAMLHLDLSRTRTVASGGVADQSLTELGTCLAEGFQARVGVRCPRGGRVGGRAGGSRGAVAADSSVPRFNGTEVVGPLRSGRRSPAHPASVGRGDEHGDDDEEDDPHGDKVAAELHPGLD